MSRVASVRDGQGMPESDFDRAPRAEWTLAGLHEALVQRLPPMPRSAAVLDLGCGTGAWLQRLSQLGLRDLWGLDRKPETDGAGWATWVQADLDADDWKLGDKQFDLVTAIEVVEHLENPGRFLDGVASHLASGGYFLVTTPNIQSIRARLRFLVSGRLPHFDDKSDPTHVHPWTLGTLKRMASRHRLRILRAWGYPRRGSLAFRKATWLAAAALSVLLREEVAGDVLCVLLVRTQLPAAGI